MVGWCSPRSCPLNTTKPSFMAPSFRLPQRCTVHTPKGMTVSLPLLHIHHLGDLFSELILQSYSLDLALAIDSFPLAGSHYQLLPHNTEEKPKPEKIQKILALVLTSTLVGRFSLLSDCEVYLKARNFCLLSPPECKFHVVPPVHWHPYIESSCFPVLGWFFWVFNIRGSISFVCMNPNPALTSAMFAWWLALFASLASLSPLP